MAGLAKPINPKGTYLRIESDPAATAATEISLVELKVEPGDYLSLMGSGSFKYGGPSSPAVQSMVGCFFQGPIRIAAGKFGQEQPITTLPTNIGNLPTDVVEDFGIPFNSKIIVRVPGRATSLKLSPNDSYFGDNVSVGYSIIIARPNKANPLPSNASVLDDQSLPGEHEESDDDTDLVSAINRIKPAVLPIATTFLASPFSNHSGAETRPQWRGWYANTGWKPGNSKYNTTSRPYRKHGGWDIFAPTGSKLVAAIGPARLDWISPIAGFGNVAVLRFKYQGNEFNLIYGHVQALIGQPRIISAGDEIAIVGCAGNSGTAERCGQELPSGAYTDHVHVGLYTGAKTSSKNHVNPSTLLKWNIITPIDYY